MENENNILKSAADYDYLKASSTQDCTGLIPSGIVYEEELDVVREIVRNIMENTFKLSVPLKVDIEVGNDWYEAK